MQPSFSELCHRQRPHRGINSFDPPIPSTCVNRSIPDNPAHGSRHSSSIRKQGLLDDHQPEALIFEARNQPGRKQQPCLPDHQAAGPSLLIIIFLIDLFLFNSLSSSSY
jgi:hypothetical protein